MDLDGSCQILPSTSSSRLAMILSSVDLPAPLGPTMPILAVG